MNRWRYSVQRGDNWASTRTFFDSIEDALAFIYGQERFNPPLFCRVYYSKDKSRRGRGGK